MANIGNSWSLTFHSGEPNLWDLDVDHGDMGLHIERIMRSPAYLDELHPMHKRALSDVRAGMEILYPEEKPAEGFSGKGFTFNARTGEPVEIAPPQVNVDALMVGGDDVNKAD